MISIDELKHNESQHLFPYTVDCLYVYLRWKFHATHEEAVNRILQLVKDQLNK